MAVCGLHIIDVLLKYGVLTLLQLEEPFFSEQELKFDLVAVSNIF